MSQNRSFPDDFIWGAATASYQIEGAAAEDGRGPSIWDTFSKTPGKVLHGHTGDIACDHYHRYESDVKLMAELGIRSYRFSLAWPRVFPAKGKVLDNGFDFYKRLLEQLHKHGITPAATIYHWDLPQWIEDEGGWSNRAVVDYYLEFAEKAFRELGDQIPMWITHNEPWCASLLSYGIGEHAPGLRDWRRAYRAAHHLLLSHGEAVKLYRSLGLKGEIGITLNLTPAYSASDSPQDVAAAARQDCFSNRWFLDPLFKGEYPAEFMERVERFCGDLDVVRAGDMEAIATKMDFLGINFYTRSLVADDPNDPLLGVKHLKTDNPVTDMGWEVYPDALYDLLHRLQKDYTDLPIYITENGAASADVVEDGNVHDADRIAYLHQHLEAARKFISEGGNLKGYYLWSLLDNFEWAFGYTKRFGIIYVDYDTQERIPKDSFEWYRQVIAANSLPETVQGTV
ncbi:beta-glucosidase [Alicyclobacillus hesperidum]|uniref:Beta-glucosidase n=1 Tax=Alicyclobacillus hesperidum TaxID=89784 RepID=A0A1H2TE56_9BACL|nr:GH1 family beta-glucosidase [Alicyclobacillus hesperidum]GLV13869.1 beta-glucosidase [Alicyclobacillus hesperidum]SDW42191.1 broad-specificity cellobiase [Alicyclobacillus hesperidum]